MARRIRLTWRNRPDQVIEEECDLVEEDDEIFMQGTDIALIDMNKVLALHGEVVFEDEYGLFSLKPDQIVHIEIL